MSWNNEFAGVSCRQFLETISTPEWCWAAKRLSGNDTGANGSHQAGLYLPRVFFERAFPSIVTKAERNPDMRLGCFFPKAEYDAPNVRAIYYNNKFHLDANGKYGSRNEFRLTTWGGSGCPVQDPEQLGALIVFAYRDGNAVCWVADTPEDEATLQFWLGQDVEPGEVILDSSMRLPPSTPEDKILSHIPPEWFDTFPKGCEIASLAVSLVPFATHMPDELLLERREIESVIFYEIERQHVEPLLEKGFSCVTDFVKAANGITNRRKSRAGLSLELHLSHIFTESKLAFEEQCVTENRKKPDFLFPSGQAYRDAPQPRIELFMLAAKTCCKDRWRQVLNEANKIPTKHLFTLQEGVSANQLAEMASSDLQLVIPEQHRKAFPKSERDDLLNLEQFIETIRASQTA